MKRFNTAAVGAGKARVLIFDHEEARNIHRGYFNQPK
jgi:hypothetical protein